MKILDLNDNENIQIDSGGNLEVDRWNENREVDRSNEKSKSTAMEIWRSTGAPKVGGRQRSDFLEEPNLKFGHCFL